ncbi:MAG: MlaD family protein [Desulfobacteraceae bacterium]|nr:MlaD family protein [Desulfobacteraceae bacterium]
MATLKTKFSVGLFIIVGLAIIVIGVIWLGMSKYLEKGRFFVAYFDESVQGLDKDSAVKYRGVYIGRVHHIGVAPDGKLIEVVMKIESDFKAEMITQDVVAQLKSVGITGLMFIELDRKHPLEQMIYPPATMTPPYPVVATRPSDISKIFKGIEEVFAIFRAIDTKTISDQLTAALKKINHTIDNAQLDAVMADMRKTMKNLQQLMASEDTQRLMKSFESAADKVNTMAVNADGGITEIRSTVGHLDHVLNNSGDDLRQITADLKASAQQVKRAMETASTLLENTDRKVDTMERQIVATLVRIEQASDTLNRFLDRIAVEPSGIIFSGPPEEKPAAP